MSLSTAQRIQYKASPPEDCGNRSKTVRPILSIREVI
jgi:hypothetical protein